MTENSNWDDTFAVFKGSQVLFWMPPRVTQHAVSAPRDSAFRRSVVVVDNDDIDDDDDDDDDDDGSMTDVATTRDAKPFSRRRIAYFGWIEWQ